MPVMEDMDGCPKGSLLPQNVLFGNNLVVLRQRSVHVVMLGGTDKNVLSGRDTGV